MNEAAVHEQFDVDVGEFCRQVEEHLARVNGGHLVRIVGPAFDLVRQWALAGIPLSVVRQGVTQKAERHRIGRSTRPLRLEFCEADVRSVHEAWARAIGLHGRRDVTEPPIPAEPEDRAAHSSSESPSRRPSLSKQIDRAVDRLSKAAGRLDLPEPFRDRLHEILQEIVDARDVARGARGAARDEVVTRLAAIDARLVQFARETAGDQELQRFAGDAARDLHVYRGRLPPDAWQRSINLGVDRLVRDRFGLPTLLF